MQRKMAASCVGRIGTHASSSRIVVGPAHWNGVLGIPRRPEHDGTALSVPSGEEIQLSLAVVGGGRGPPMLLHLLLWCLLLVLCWPLALLALILFPIVWLVLLPLRLLGIAVGGVFDLLRAIVHLPARLLGGPSSVGRKAS